MKACILAGGEGQRLRPLTADLPKPLVPILGKPVLHYTIEQLCSHGVTDMAVTLMYLPQKIRDSLGDGSQWDVRLHFYEEAEPMGTAGGVRACASFLGDEDFAVISGDAVCDFNLQTAFRFHQEHDADVTVVLHRQKNPLEYGLVQTDRSGRIVRFAEKPTWKEVFTDVVNTGIYILSPRVLREIPENQPFDFSKDLFPRLLAKRARVFGCELEGYWCDIGDAGAYLQCTFDAMSGRIRFDGALVKSESPRPDITVREPVRIAHGAQIAAGAKLGPNVWVGPEAKIGENCVVRDSVIDGILAAECDADGAILCADSRVGEGSVLEAGAVVGSDVQIGAHCRIGQGVRVYPEVRVADNTFVRHTLTTGGARSVLFDEGVLRGQFGVGLTAETAGAIGMACAAILHEPRVALGATVGTAAQSVAQSVLGALTAAGCHVLTHDIPFAAGAAAVARLLQVPLSIFIDSEDELVIRLCDQNGLPLLPALQKKLEGMIARGEGKRVPSPAAGRQTPIVGGGAWLAASVGKSPVQRKLCVAVHGNHPAAVLLRETLERAGFAPPQQTALCHDGLSVSISRDGYHFLINEPNLHLDCRQTEALVCLAAVLEDPERPILLWEDVPQAIERMAAAHGGRVERVGRDGGETDIRYAAQPFAQNAIAAAVFFLRYLDTSGATLATLQPLLPTFGIYSEELPCKCGRSVLMRSLAELPQVEAGRCGLVWHANSGTVRIRPSAVRRALVLAAESTSEETAEALVADLRRKTAQIEANLPSRDFTE